ncbi:MAG: SEC-C metal-binding domain-containing protein [Pseudonocardiaceae bacterium]
MTDALPATSPALIDVIIGVLAEDGPLTDDQLAAALAIRGVDLGDDPDEALDEALADGEGLVAMLPDERWASLPALLAGRVFTHRVTGPELEHDILEVNPDLAAVDLLIEREEYQLLADGASVVGVLPPVDADILAERGVPLDLVSDHGSLLLPPGYLRGKGLGEGDVLALGLTGDGWLLERVAEPVVTPEAVAGLGQRLSAVLAAEPAEPMSLEDTLWTVCAEDPTLFTEPLPPLAVALDACGLEHDDDWYVAAQGFDFRRWQVGKCHAVIAQRHDLSDDEALAALALVTLYGRVAEMLDEQLTEQDSGAGALATFAASAVKTTVVFLAEPAVAEAVLAETIGTGSDGAAALGLFAETLEPLAPRAARPALWWLRGKAHEALADLTRAEAAYHAAESVDPQWPLVLVDLARYASDRGDAARGLALLRRAGTSPDDPLVQLLERFEAGPRPDLGRNQPCWCGSGRKYKKCHLDHEQLPLDERADWLYRKAGMFLLDGPWCRAMIEAAEARAQHAEDEALHAILGALGDPLVTDAVLFEGGAFAEFVATRGELLPEDERLLAERWLRIGRSVHEIERVQRGVGFTLRDVRTGEVHQIRERTASQTVKAGQLVCARVVPAGDTTQIFGGMEPVALHERDKLIALLDSEPDSLDLVTFLTRRFAPPVLLNTEGEPLVRCVATLRTGDPVALAAQTAPVDEDSTGVDPADPDIAAALDRFIRPGR